MNAKIEDNRVYCPICNMELGNMTGAYGLANHEGKNYYWFERYCMGKCGGKYVYYADITLNGKSEKFSFDIVSEVNEDED